MANANCTYCDGAGEVAESSTRYMRCPKCCRELDVTLHTDTHQKFMNERTGEIRTGKRIICRHRDPFCPCNDGNSCNHERAAVNREGK